MSQRRRVAVTVESRRLIVRRSMGQRHVWCAQCSAWVQSVTLEDAAALRGVKYIQTDAGEYHFVDEAGSGLICLNSVLVSINKQND